MAFDPNLHWDGGGPTLLVHELSHAYDSQRGEWADEDSLPRHRHGGPHRGRPTASTARPSPTATSTRRPSPRSTRSGIDLDGDGDRDMLDDHPDWFTENEIRDEMGIDNRDVY